MRIDLIGLRKSFEEGREIIHCLDFSEDVTSMALIGPSGGGKSTLLRIIGGLILPSSGEVLLDGQKMGHTAGEILAYRRQIGFVFQAKGLFYHLTGLENITMPLIRVHGYNKADAYAAAKTLLTRFGLMDDAEKYPNELSGGQQQRIAIARAVAARPKLLLLDEPTSALDPELTTEVLETVGELKSDGLSIMLVTHEMGFAKNACDKVIFLSEGSVLEMGDGKQLFSHPGTPQLSAFLNKVLEWNV